MSRTRSLLGLVVAGALTFVAAAAAGDDRVTPGEAYRVWLDGRRINLTGSPADDTFPEVSPDGRKVAFLSDRGTRRRGFAYLYVVGSEGHGLERVSATLSTDQSLLGQIAWSPDSKRLAVAEAGGLLYMIRPGTRQRLIAARPPFILEPAWSPDGRMIAFRTGEWRHNEVGVVTASGRAAWHVRGSRFAWSPPGRIAILAHGSAGRPETIHVYNEQGRVLAAFRGRSFAWSPDGGRLASVTANRTEVHTVDGRLVFKRTVPGLRAGQSNGLVWAGWARVVVGGVESTLPGGQIGLDIHTGRTRPASDWYFGLLSPDRTLVAEIANTRGGYALRVRRRGCGMRTLARRSPCPDLVEADVEWLPDGRSLVYDFKCQP